MKQILLPATAAVMTACAAAPGAVAENAIEQRTITVNGQGKATAAPDMAVITIGVRTQAETASGALRANSAEMEKTIKTLRDLDVAKRDIQTSGLSINPRYNYENNNRRDPQIIGYNASNNVTVRLRDLDRAGRVIDQAIQSGGNSLNGIQFTFADAGPLQEEARKDAVRDARAKATLLTEAAGVDLGQVLTIQDGYVSTPGPQPVMARMSMDSAESVPIEAGESMLSATVTIVYEIN